MSYAHPTEAEKRAQVQREVRVSYELAGVVPPMPSAVGVDRRRVARPVIKYQPWNRHTPGILALSLFYGEPTRF